MLVQLWQVEVGQRPSVELAQLHHRRASQVGEFFGEPLAGPRRGQIAHGHRVASAARRLFGANAQPVEAGLEVAADARFGAGARGQVAVHFQEEASRLV